MKVTLKESQSPRYLYINPKTNFVHLIMPIMSGTDIGLDNTCKSVYSLQEFFGLAGMNRQSDALSELVRYQAALKHDINYLPDSAEKALKAERLSQIEHYLLLLKPLQEDPLVQNPLKEVFPRYPEPLQYLMQQQVSNLHSIILRPSDQDIQLRTTAIKPVFSLPHDMSVNGYRQSKASIFHEILIGSLGDVSFRARSKSKDELIHRVVSKLSGQTVDFEAVRHELTAEVRGYLGIELSFNHTQGNPDVVSEVIDQACIDSQMGIAEDNPATHEMYAQALIEYCAPHLLEIQADSPFNTIRDTERLSIAIQLFLAEINIQCYEQGIAMADFGLLLESQIELARFLLQIVKQAINEGHPVEESILSVVNTHYQAFQLKNQLQPAQIASIKQGFKAHYEQIKSSPHFDEFMLLSKRPGTFFAHQGCIATSLANFLTPQFFKLNAVTQAFLEKSLHDLAQIEKPNNMLVHKNAHIHQGEIYLDLKTYDNQALQALYDRLVTYSDPNIKTRLMAEFKQERPDFKPQNVATVFLQYVAYGQQNEAEALLKEQPELAQELLRAHNRAFSDYYGRTFTCTAYEYVYWAKDAHMMRMLEKHMDAGTKAFILSRILEIEKPENPNASPDFFANPNLPLKRNKGLNYITKNAQGEIIHHNDAHFDLQPLKDALQHYITAYKQSPRATEADCAALNEIWVKIVGGAQRQVPAHIAQEYCHPNRSFQDITNKKSLIDAAIPSNLKRQLIFYNYDIGKSDLWFTPASHVSESGLGFSIAIFRGAGGLGGRAGAEGGETGWWLLVGRFAMIDLAALTAIDEARTNDLKQSLANLSLPLNAPLSLSP